jgi:hypothetical protein
MGEEVTQEEVVGTLRRMWKSLTGSLGVLGWEPLKDFEGRCHAVSCSGGHSGCFTWKYLKGWEDLLGEDEA